VKIKMMEYDEVYVTLQRQMDGTRGSIKVTVEEGASKARVLNYLNETNARRFYRLVAPRIAGWVALDNST
jgi:hypothetical protein